ncbi:hypothetical protein GCM10023224_14210 [Streptomonospora halophila]|uniref:DUF5666 domain-containing protein n=1 Tax=Streptomonospora halophila TaxID=427369 RepID=A0ABP9GAI2_9ACTN
MSSFRKIATVVAGVALAVGGGGAAAFASGTAPEQTVEVPAGVDAKPAKPSGEAEKGAKPAKGEAIRIIKDGDGVRIIRGEGGEVPVNAEPAEPAKPAE